VADEGDDYEGLRAELEAEVPPERRRATHLVLI
jgi:hypothetical protein